jgi:SAM-dependent methyltransferase
MVAEARRRLARRLQLLQPTRRIRFLLTLRELDRPPGGRPQAVLDVGCSEGLLAELIAERHPDWTIDAVDNDAEVVSVAASRLAAAGAANVRVSQADIVESLGDELYDTVIALECLHMIPDDEPALASLAAATKPGGMLLAHVPFRDWKRVSRAGRSHWPGEVRSGYTTAELSDKLERAGYHDVRFTPTSRSLARLGAEVNDRLPKSRLATMAWYPVSATIAWLDRNGLTWGPATSFLVVAYR